MMAYFKKVDPRVKVMISSGDWVQFEAVEWNIGVYPPEGKGISGWLTEELRKAISEGRGGMTEIQADEYNALIEKKKANPAGLNRPNREEFTMKLNLERALAARQDSLPHVTVAPLAGVADHRNIEIGPMSEPPKQIEAPRPTASKHPKSAQ